VLSKITVAPGDDIHISVSVSTTATNVAVIDATKATRPSMFGADRHAEALTRATDLLQGIRRGRRTVLVTVPVKVALALLGVSESLAVQRRSR
jgi:hypothetical protein